MHTPELFKDLLIILLVSVPVALLCLRLKLPLIVGLMLTGIGIGPYGLKFVTDIAGIEILAEIGVMLLLFTIGLEFSISRLGEIRRLVIVGGGLQVGVTIGATVGISMLLGRPLAQSIFFGFLIALSSTAIVLKSYIDRNEVDSPHGKAGVGILLFQDISIVLMLLLIPSLAGSDKPPTEVLYDLGISLGALIVIVVTAWYFLPKVLAFISKQNSTEVFLLTVVLLVLGMSWITNSFGMSLAIGAFIAGMVLADSEYVHQVESEVLSFRDVFNSIFFVSIGMLLSLSIIFENIFNVAVLVVALMLGKGLIIWAIVWFLGFPQRVAVTVGIGLAQIGEFSFVVAKSGKAAGMLSDGDYQAFLAASVISMIATPFLIAAAPGIGIALQSVLSDGKSGDLDNSEDDIHMTATGGLEQHVVIVGYGLNGRNLARVLRRIGVPYTILEANAEVVKRARLHNEKINFGDATRREVLIHAGIERANVMVLAMSDPPAARRTVAQARKLNEKLHIIVRTRYTSEINQLTNIGANEVIPEEFETSIEIFARVLHRYGVPRSTIESQISSIRKQGYEMLRTASIADEPLDNLSSILTDALTETVRIDDDSPAIGKSLGELDLRGKTGATVLALLHKGDARVSPGASYVLSKDDVIFLSGRADAIERATELLSPDNEIGGFNP
jgi:monovalent cation:H+ antiporter-2, CPA2 family